MLTMLLSSAFWDTQILVIAGMNHVGAPVGIQFQPNHDNRQKKAVSFIVLLITSQRNALISIIMVSFLLLAALSD